MIDCPTGAITRESDSLIVTINDHDHPTRACIGCGNCAERCPWGNIIMVPFGTRADGKLEEEATKCDLCHTRERGPGLRADVPARLRGPPLLPRDGRGGRAS